MNTSQKLGKKLFSFAVVADTHLNQDEMDCNSPFPVNTLANVRMRHVVQDMNGKDVDFVLHLGDIIHPVPAVKELYVRAAQRFHKQVKDLTVPLYLTPGNHDIGDKPMPWAPAGTITNDYIDLWHEVFGKDYYSFSHQNIVFVVLNSQLCNSGLEAEAQQEVWFEAELQKHVGKRIFLATHYPFFMYASDEAEHYDNVAEPARSRLLALMAHARVEGIFAGHVHNFWYLQEDAVHHYLLPSTAFVRQDYSEMFKAPPALEALEAGRNDAEKLGYFIVHMYEKGHVCRMVRTRGTCLQEGERDTKKTTDVTTVSPLENKHASLGFDLREAWSHPVTIAPSGALDEFDRKEVRNDYPLLALWEMGVKHLRVPFHDLRDSATRRRMEHLITLGHSFTLFSFGEPSEKDIQLVAENAALLRAWEMACRWDTLPHMAKIIADIRQRTHLPLYLSRMWEHDDNKSPDGRYFHVMNHGLTAKNIAQNAQHFTEVEALSGLKDVGYVFRIMRHEDIWTSLQDIIAYQKQCGRPVSVHIRMAGFNPAAHNCSATDDVLNAQRLAQALICTAYGNIHMFADTLVDIDRGYFPRHGVLDSICNPRMAAHVIAHIYGFLHESEDALTGLSYMDDAKALILFGMQGTSMVGFLFPKHDDATPCVTAFESMAHEKGFVNLCYVDARSGRKGTLEDMRQDILAYTPVYMIRAEKYFPSS